MRSNRVLYPSLTDTRVQQSGNRSVVSVPVPINTQVYERGIPTHLTPNVTLSGDIKTWSVAQCQLFDLSGGTPVRVRPDPGWSPGPNPAEDTKTGCVVLNDLKSNGTYRLDISLTCGNGNPDKNKVQQQIAAGFVVIDRPPP